MRTYKVRTQVSSEGHIVIEDLPFSPGEYVEVSISEALPHPGADVEERIAHLKQSFGTIASDAEITLVSTSREQLYGPDAR